MIATQLDGEYDQGKVSSVLVLEHLGAVDYEQMSGTKRIHHPLVGGLTLLYETLTLPDQPEQQLVTYTAADTESQTALDLLASIAAQAESAPAHEPADKRAGAKTRS